MIPAIILSAGESRRMGRPKATLPLTDGDTFLTRIVRTMKAAGIDDVIIVLGYHADAIRAHLVERRVPARVVVNPRHDEGQLTSLLAALELVDGPEVEAVLITLVDVPVFAEATARAVVDCYRRTGASVVRPTRGHEHGHPMLIDRSLFALLRHADPLTGAKPIVRAHASPAGDFPMDDPGAFADVDTPADYDELLRRLDP